MCDLTAREGKASSGKKSTGKSREKAAVNSASNFEISSDDSDDAVPTDRIKAILNQISAQNLNITIHKLRSLSIKNERRLKVLVKAIFEKSANDERNAEVYAKLCKHLLSLRVASTGSECVCFKNLLLEHSRQEVQICFVDEGSRSSQLWFEKMDAIGFWSSGSGTVSPLADKIRMKKMGVVVFVGHLFRVDILTVECMKAVINKLFSFEDEYVWNCLCSLLLLIGGDMEAKKQDLALCLKKMQEVADERQLSASAREKLKHLVECRRNKWRQVTGVQDEIGFAWKQGVRVSIEGNYSDDSWALGTLGHVVLPRRVIRDQMRQAKDKFNES